MKFEFKCPKCKETAPTLRQMGTKIGVYCKNCGKWLFWVNDRYEMRKVKKAILDSQSDDKAWRDFSYRKDGIVVSCGECNSMLYDDRQPAPGRYFNLKNAKFCPNCGKEFI